MRLFFVRYGFAALLAAMLAGVLAAPAGAGEVPPVPFLEPDRLVGCAKGGETFPASVLTAGTPPLIENSAQPGVADAVNWFLDMVEGNSWPQDGWRLLHANDTQASAIHLGARQPGQLTFMSASRTEGAGGAWKWNGASSGGGCNVVVRPAEGFGRVSFAVLSATGSTIVLRASELDCASGQPMGDRFQEPEYAITDTTVEVFLAVEAQQGFHTCQGSPSQEVVIELSEPIGDREVRNGNVVGGLSGLLRANDSSRGDVFAAGTQYCAATYTDDRPSTTWNHQSWFGPTPVSYVVDLDFPGDDGTVILAPADGTVEQVTVDPGDGWGNSVVWTSADGVEQLHLAHLTSVTKTGPVVSGDQIGILGRTGTHLDDAHLHVARAVNGTVAPVYLSGDLIEPIVDPESQDPPLEYDGWPCAGQTYTSTGPIAPVFCDGRRATIFGTPGDDRLEGTGGDDVIAGLQGNDQIMGFGGDDVICGGKGDDVLVGGKGFDIIFGAQGDDMLWSTDGIDDLADERGARMFGGAGNDVIHGSHRWDRMQGGPGQDTMLGYAGQDWIRSGPDHDTVDGGGGVDDIRTAGGRDTITVGTGDKVKAGIGRDTCTITGEPQLLWSCEVLR